MRVQDVMDGERERERDIEREGERERDQARLRIFRRVENKLRFKKIILRSRYESSVRFRPLVFLRSTVCDLSSSLSFFFFQPKTG